MAELVRDVHLIGFDDTVVFDHQNLTVLFAWIFISKKL